MVQYIHFRDPRSAEMTEMLDSLPKCPGTCFFIDINHSTDMKYTTPVSDWAGKLNNTFNFISFLNDFPDNVVKGIGDEIMLFIPDDVLRQKSSFNTYFALLEEIHATLYNIKHFPVDGLFLNCKVGIHYCTEVYNISFFENANDYYGSDIDLTARLMNKGIENRIVLSEKFYTKVRNDLISLNLQENSGCLARISEKFIENFKGIPTHTEFRVIDIK
jgi:class 3 adenylate cyclase